MGTTIMSRNNEKDLLNNLYESVKERLQWSIDKNEIEDMDRDELIDMLQDMSHEVIDGELPIYYSDMAKLLAENTNFATVEDDGLLPENPTVWDIITLSVYELLSGEYHGIACDVVDELLPHLDIESQLIGVSA
jgi:hypothetical protein